MRGSIRLLSFIDGLWGVSTSCSTVFTVVDFAQKLIVIENGTFHYVAGGVRLILFSVDKKALLSVSISSPRDVIRLTSDGA